jgi:hypothetical protein
MIWACSRYRPNRATTKPNPIKAKPVRIQARKVRSAARKSRWSGFWGAPIGAALTPSNLLRSFTSQGSLMNLGGRRSVPLWVSRRSVCLGYVCGHHASRFSRTSASLARTHPTASGPRMRAPTCIPRLSHRNDCLASQKRHHLGAPHRTLLWSAQVKYCAPSSGRRHPKIRCFLVTTEGWRASNTFEVERPRSARAKKRRLKLTTWRSGRRNRNASWGVIGDGRILFWTAGPVGSAGLISHDSRNPNNAGENRRFQPVFT